MGGDGYVVSLSLLQGYAEAVQRGSFVVMVIAFAEDAGGFLVRSDSVAEPAVQHQSGAKGCSARPFAVTVTVFPADCHILFERGYGTLIVPDVHHGQAEVSQCQPRLKLVTAAFE